MRNDTLRVHDRSRSEWITLINEWIHDERDRTILVRHLLDGASLERCAEEVGLEWRQTLRRYKRAKERLALRIK